MANPQEKLLATYAAEIQEFETAAFQVLLDRWLETAVGVQLDGLGSIVGKARAGSDDDTYRLLLRAQVLLNRSSGTVPEILEILELVIPGFTIELQQHFPAGFQVIVDQAPLPADDGPVVAFVVGQARAAGVRGLFQYFETAPVYRFDGAGGSVMDGGYFYSTTIER